MSRNNTFKCIIIIAMMMLLSILTACGGGSEAGITKDPTKIVPPIGKPTAEDKKKAVEEDRKAENAKAVEEAKNQDNTTPASTSTTSTVVPAPQPTPTPTPTPVPPPPTPAKVIFQSIPNGATDVSLYHKSYHQIYDKPLTSSVVNWTSTLTNLSGGTVTHTGTFSDFYVNSPTPTYQVSTIDPVSGGSKYVSQTRALIELDIKVVDKDSFTTVNKTSFTIGEWEPKSGILDEVKCKLQSNATSIQDIRNLGCDVADQGDVFVKISRLSPLNFDLGGKPLDQKVKDSWILLKKEIVPNNPGYYGTSFVVQMGMIYRYSFDMPHNNAVDVVYLTLDPATNLITVKVLSGNNCYHPKLGLNPSGYYFVRTNGPQETTTCP